VLVALIWGSTWIVIKDQIGPVPPGWTITWRFLVATLGMFAVAGAQGESLRLPAPAMRVAVFVGLAQFCGNFQFVYRAEQHLTSGIVAVLYALLMVPNALFGRILLGQRLSARFVAGSAVALAGISLLLLHEWRSAPVGGEVGLGVLLTIGGLLSASLANVAQGAAAVRTVRPVPLVAWSMLWGTLFDAALAVFNDGAPVLQAGAQYWAGVAYLALIGSVVTFPLYFGMIRTMGAGRAAYNGVAVPVVAMLISTVVEQYRWTVLAAAGAALALAGLVVALGSSRLRRE